MPPSRRTQRPEAHPAVGDLEHLPIHRPALDPAQHQVADADAIKPHRRELARL
jgi:hypothetical protein